jgi:putative PIN family toxin of toxin-antitoxin system
MKHERVVFDTNVLISALLLASSTPAQALEIALSNGQLVATSATMRELATKLHSTKFDRYVSQHARDALLIRLTGLIELVDVVIRFGRRAIRKTTSFWKLL